MRLITEQWFDEDNIWPLYTELGYLAKYDFDRYDKDAIIEGLKNVNESNDIWFNYDLLGEKPISTSISMETGSSNYTIKVYSDHDIDREIGQLLSMCQIWKISKI